MNIKSFVLLFGLIFNTFTWADSAQRLVSASFNGTLECQGSTFTFSRASTATYFDSKTGKLVEALPNVPRFEIMPGKPYGSNVGLLLEGRSQNLLLNSSFEEAEPVWNARQLKIERIQDFALHGQWSEMVKGQGILYHTPIVLNTRAPWNEYYLSCHVRRVDGKTLESDEVHVFASTSAEGANQIVEEQVARLTDNGWIRKGGWFPAVGQEGTRFTCGFYFSRKDDYFIDAVQLEPVLRWPRGASSYIPTGKTAGVRAGDSLSLPTKDAFHPAGGTITLWTANREDSPIGLLFHVGGSGIVQFNSNSFSFGGKGGRVDKSLVAGWRQVALVWNGQQTDFFINGYSNHSGHGPLDYQLQQELEPLSYLAHPQTMSAHGVIADFTVWDQPLKDWELKQLTATGTIEGAKPPVETEVGVPVAFKTNNAGKVTVGIYDQGGRLRRQLLVGEKHQPGQHTISWDGRDDDGKPLPIGDYEVRVAVSNIHSVFDGKVGNNSPSPGDDGLQYRSGEYIDVRAEPDGSFLTLSTWGEGARLLQKIRKDGSVAWSCTRCDPGPGGLYALATDGEWAYVLTTVTNEKDPQTGKALIREAIARFRRDTGTLGQFPFGATLSVNKPRPVLTEADAATQRVGHCNPIPGVGIWGLDAANGKLYVSLYYENRIAVFDTEKGKELQSISVKNPLRLTGAKTGVLYVVTEQTIRRFSIDGTDLGVAVKGLEAPWSVALAKNGDIYVTDLGPSQQIKVFTSPGHLKATYGKKGGGIEGGSLLPDKLAYPMGINLGDDGTCYVADWGNQRLLVMDAQFKIKYSLLSRHFWRVCYNPFDPDLLYDYFGAWRLVEYRVDPEKKTWKLLRQWPMSETALGNRNDSGPLLFRKLGGKPFAVTPGGNPLVFEMKGERLIPRVMLGRGPYYTHEKGALFKHEYKEAWVWRDTNFDGQYQESEYEKGSWQTAIGFEDSWTDEAGNIFTVNHNSPGPVMKIPFEGLDTKGLPRYSWSHAQVLIPTGHEGLASLFGIITDPAGNIYITDTPGYSDYAIQPNINVRKYSPTGELLWITGRKQKGYKKPGMLFLPGNMAGFLDGYLFVGDMDGTIEVFTEDGLWVGRLGDDLPEQFLNLGETFGHCVFRHPKTKKVYAYTSPDCTYRMSRLLVEGLDKVDRFRTKIQLSKMSTGIRKAEEEGPPPMRVLQRVGPIDIDGNLGGIEWGLTQPSLNAPAYLPEVGEPQATCWAQWDDEALYLAFKIVDSTPAVSKQLDDMRWSADQVEFYLCTNYTQHAWHGDYTASDFDLALGPDAKGRVDAWVLANGFKKSCFLPGAKVAIKLLPGYGYSMEARLPWSSLGGFKPGKGAEIGWNFVVDWGTPDGMAHLRLLKWRNGLHYMPQNWGKAVLE